jgi:dienelactone hydrolase
MITEYFRAQTAQLRDQCLTDIKTLEDWKAESQVYRKQLFEMLSLDPFPEKTDLKPVITGRAEHDEFTVENLHFQSMPGLYITGNLYIPKNLSEPAPTILYVCGHAVGIKDGIRYGNKAAYQYHGAWFARHGYVCFVIDTIHRGEIEGIHHGTHQYKMWWWNSRGYSSAGLEAFNSIRALDYLETRKEVDSSRFGVTGRSGGGAYSWWLAALDERIKVAVPVAGITDLHNHIIDGTVEGHCDCMFMVHTYQWDYPLVAALVAPRPLLISNSDKDGIFPLDGVVRVHKKVSKIYELHGAEKNLGLHITEGPHRSTQALRVHTFTWFNRFLKGETPLIDKPAVSFFEWEQLKVFDELPADNINMKIQETFTAKAPPPQVPQSAARWTRQRDGWMEALREKSFRGWPTDTQAGSLDVKQVFSVQRHGIRLSAFDFTSQQHITLRLYLAQQAGLEKADRVVIKVLDEQGWTKWLTAVGAGFADELGDQTLPETNKEAFEQYQQMLRNENDAIVYVTPRGIGPTLWRTDERGLKEIRRRFMLLGQTLDGMRTWDLRRAIQAVRSRSIESLRNVPVQLQGQSNMAGIALYASLFEPDIAGLNLSNLPCSHHDGPIYLNVLRYLDIPAAVAMATERCRVTLYQNDDTGWQFPRDVANKLGWPEKQFQIRIASTDNKP